MALQLLIVGSSGLVGRQVLEMALADARVGTVIAPVRRTLPAHPKLQSPQVDFEHLPHDAHWWKADAVICALGTTMRIAGSAGAFRRVDHDYPLMVARLALEHGTRAYVLNSATGADASSRIFYNRVKGELERDLCGMGFTSLTLVRPGLLGGKREEFRPGERALAAVLRLAGPVLPRRWRISPVARVAAALLAAALDQRPGVHVIGSGELA